MLPTKKSYPVEYQAWCGMKARCLNPKYRGFKDYGGRGISICRQWLHSFPTFLRDMGPKPLPNLSLDRKDTNGHYEPSNCRWATKKEQSENRRFCHALKVGGKILTLMDASKAAGISDGTLWSRLIRQKRPLEQAMQKGFLYHTRKNTKMLTHNGVTRCIAEWARALSINGATLKARIQKGWPLERALSPARKKASSQQSLR